MFPTPAFVEGLSGDLKRDLLAFLPELILCGSIVLLLLARFIPVLSRAQLTYLALVFSVGALLAAVFAWPGSLETLARSVTGTDVSVSKGPIPARGGYTGFYGLVVFDTFGLYLRGFLLFFLCLLLWLSLLTGIPDREDSVDYVTLLVGGTVGMMLMVSANHLLTMFVAVEMASVPSYALAGFMKGRRQGSEAALKYVVYGASAAGVMLYGISLITGVTGAGSFQEIAHVVADSQEGVPLPVVIGAVCVIVGLGFKLAAVPFHFWCPDVFEGAPAEIGAFLSVASKAAALGLSARFLFALAGPEVAGQTEAAGSILAVAWALFASITTTFGNLAALAQTNLKRLLAYSTIAHAGFMMIALVPIGPRAVAPLIYYVSAYLLMNLGAFAVVAFVRNKTGSEDISAYRGLVRRSPVLAVGLAFCLLSLLGIPPLTGFAAKFQVFAVLYETGRTFGTDSPFAWLYFGLLVIAGLNTAISAGYYLRIVRTMVLDDAGDLPAIPVSLGTRVFVTLMAALIIVAGILWDPITRASRMATHSFDRSPGQVVEKKK